MPDLNNLEEQLVTVNKIITQLNPMIGAVEGLGMMVYEIVKRVKVDNKTQIAFNDQWLKWQAQRANLAAALDEFHQKYPDTPAPVQPASAVPGADSPPAPPAGSQSF